MVAATGSVSEQIVEELANGTYPPQSMATRLSIDPWLALGLEAVLFLMMMQMLFSFSI